MHKKCISCYSCGEIEENFDTMCQLGSSKLTNKSMIDIWAATVHVYIVISGAYELPEEYIIA